VGRLLTNEYWQQGLVGQFIQAAATHSQSFKRAQIGPLEAGKSLADFGAAGCRLDAGFATNFPPAIFYH
jgi:hypothetical protein